MGVDCGSRLTFGGDCGGMEATTGELRLYCGCWGTSPSATAAQGAAAGACCAGAAAGIVVGGNCCTCTACGTGAGACIICAGICPGMCACGAIICCGAAICGWYIVMPWPCGTCWYSCWYELLSKAAFCSTLGLWIMSWRLKVVRAGSPADPVGVAIAGIEQAPTGEARTGGRGAP